MFVKRSGHRGRWAAPKGARAGPELLELLLPPFGHNLYLEWALTNTDILKHKYIFFFKVKPSLENTGHHKKNPLITTY